MRRSERDELESCILEIHALPHGPEFLTGVMRTLRRLVSSPFGLYGHTDLKDGLMNTGLRYPEQIDPQRWGPVFNAHFWEHPLHEQARGIGSGQVVTLSELSGKEWARTANFNEFCRPNGVEHQLMIRLPSGSGLMEAVGVARGDRDFTSAERWRMERIRDHVLIAARRAQTLVTHRLPPVDGLIGWCTGHAVVDDHAQPRLMDGNIERLFGDFFPPRGKRAYGARLPDEVRTWIRVQLRRLRHVAPAELEEAGVFEGRARHLRAWIVPNPPRGQHDVYAQAYFPGDHAVVHARTTGATGEPVAGEDVAAQLERTAPRWELTGRQRAVLGLVVRGKSNKEIAGVLGCVEATVEFHVTALFRRSGSTNRAMLVSRFWSES